MKNADFTVKNIASVSVIFGLKRQMEHTTGKNIHIGARIGGPEERLPFHFSEGPYFFRRPPFFISPDYGIATSN